MPRPSRRDLTFSLKTFGAGMLALYIAFRLDLPQPSWALLTTYIVSQPLAGAVIAKSLARVLGTLIGALGAVAIVAVFADAREPFVLALAFWVGGCLYISVLLRDAPMAYGAMLAGYTAAIIGFPSVLAPLTTFDTAVARVSEITLGIACATLVSRLVLPLSSGAVLRRTLGAAIQAARQWTVDVLGGQGREAQGIADRRKLIADTLMLDVLRVHARLESHDQRDRDTIVRRLQARLLTLLAILVSIQDRLHILTRERPERAAAIAPLMARVSAAVTDRTAGDAITAAEIERYLPAPAEMQRDADRAVEHILVSRLADVLTVGDDMRRLRAALDGGEIPPSAEGLPSVTRYRDHGQALIAALVAATSLIVTTTFWIATGWSHGGTAAFLAAVVCSIMATLDDPAAGAFNFLRMSIVSAVVAAIYSFAVFPAIDGFPLFALSLGLFMVPLGLFIPTPTLGPVVVPLALNVLALSGVRNLQVADFADYLNGALSLIVGIGISVGMLRLLRPLGIEWTVSRLLAGLRQDLSRIAAQRSPEARSLFESRMFDRINGLIARLGARDDSHRAVLQGALASLRIGQNILALRRLDDGLPAGLAVPIDAGLRALAAHFQHAGPALLPVLDRNIAAVQAHGLETDPRAVPVLVALAGIRTSLVEHAAFFGLTGPTPALPRNPAPEASAS